MKLSFIFLFSLIILISCGSGKQNEEIISADTIKKDSVAASNYTPGKVEQKVVCSADSRFSYALYLPEGYNEKENWPLVIFFDAHAAGTLPLEKYKKLADENGFILAGSNDSKNGLAAQLYPDIKVAMFNDIILRAKVDRKRVYLAGFSGGARVAINLSIGDVTVAGLIANSAGFEPSKANLRDDLVIVGIAGNEDFNRMEQLRTESYLDSYALPHCLLEFDGPHEWAPEATMKQAFLFLDLKAKKNKLEIKNEGRLASYYESDVKDLAGVKGKTARYPQLKKFVAFYSGSLDVSSQTKELEKLKSDPAIAALLKKNEEANAMENVLQNTYYSKVFSESPEWWEQEVKKLLSEKSKEKIQLHKRVLSYISLAVYMTINSREAQSDMYQMEKFIAVYSIVDPKNAEWAYLKAILRAKQNNLAEAKSYLKKAIELGFTDKKRMKDQQDFAPMATDAEFMQLCN